MTLNDLKPNASLLQSSTLLPFLTPQNGNISFLPSLNPSIQQFTNTQFVWLNHDDNYQPQIALPNSQNTNSIMLVSQNNQINIPNNNIIFNGQNNYSSLIDMNNGERCNNINNMMGPSYVMYQVVPISLIGNNDNYGQNLSLNTSTFIPNNQIQLISTSNDHVTTLNPNIGENVLSGSTIETNNYNHGNISNNNNHDTLHHNNISNDHHNDQQEHHETLATDQITRDGLKIEVPKPNVIIQVDTKTGKPVPKYKCVECGREYKHIGNYQTHFFVHTPYAYSCQECKKSFGRKSNYDEHVRLHTGETPYTCEFCQKTFKQRHGWTDHMKIHTGEKPYACQICNRKFRLSHNLAVHKRIHSNERPYECSTCKKRFRQKSALNSHTKKVHAIHKKS